MLVKLHIQNYALIDILELVPSTGFISITGETGAGKSILAGAISLITGSRSDISILKNPDKKCVVEAVWKPDKKNHVFSLMEQNDLDFEDEIMVRREINPNGKNRAFVNDTPVSLTVLKEICTNLVDLSSQHETIQLFNANYQLALFDILAGNSTNRSIFNTLYKDYKGIQNQITSILKLEDSAAKEKDYIRFQLSELDELNYNIGEMSIIEDEHTLLSNAGLISESLTDVIQWIENENSGVLTQIEYAIGKLRKIEKYNFQLKEMADRFNSDYLDLKDLLQEMDLFSEKIEQNPTRLEFLNQRISRINSLTFKHRLNHADEIVQFRDSLSGRLDELEKLSFDRLSLEKSLENCVLQMEEIATEMHKVRMSNKKEICKKVVNLAIELGILHARFDIEVEKLNDYTEFGKDSIQFLFSANPGSELAPLTKVASGGELSRLLLSLKILAGSENNIDTMIFDEIDSGISGQVANNVGERLKNLSKYVQIFTITHLPQIAAKANQQIKVFKTIQDNQTQTQIKVLNKDERSREIAAMISGSETSENALAAARELLNLV